MLLDYPGHGPYGVAFFTQVDYGKTEMNKVHL